MMRESFLKLVQFVSIMLYVLVAGVMWGTWLSLARTMIEYDAATFLADGKHMIENLATVMAVLMISAVVIGLVAVVLLFRSRSTSPAGWRWFTAIFTESAEVRAHTLRSLRLVTVWPMISAAMLSLITGVILGLGSKYGLVRYWWVAIKLALNLILGTLIVTSLRGEVTKAADLGSQLAGGTDLDWNFSNMLYPPIVSPTALTAAFLLAVFKPWGRIRRSRADRRVKA